MSSTSRELLLVLPMIAVASLISGGLIAAMTAEPEWDPALKPYVQFVEETRGLTFDRSVAVRFADPAAEIAEETTSDTSEATQVWAEHYVALHAALGLVEPDFDLLGARADTLSSGVAAFYDPVVEEIVLPADEDPTDLELSIVHELTHALQHQNGLLDHAAWTDDENLVSLALVEGDASWVATRWWNQLPAARQDALNASWEAEREADQHEPSFTDMDFALPYAVGEPYVTSVIDSGGTAALDDMLRTLPPTSEIITDPLGSVDSISSEVHDLQDERFDEDGLEDWGTLGPVKLIQMLIGEAGPARTLEAVTGYNGDAYFRDGDCVNVVVWFDSKADVAEFSLGLFSAGLRPDEVLTTNRTVTFDSCSDDPIADPADPAIEPVVGLVALNWVTADLALFVDTDAARCGAMAAVARIDWNGEVDWDQLDSDAREIAATDCS